MGGKSAWADVYRQNWRSSVHCYGVRQEQAHAQAVSVRLGTTTQTAPCPIAAGRAWRVHRADTVEVEDTLTLEHVLAVHNILQPSTMALHRYHLANVSVAIVAQ